MLRLMAEVIQAMISQQAVIACLLETTGGSEHDLSSLARLVRVRRDRLILPESMASDHKRTACFRASQAPNALDSFTMPSLLSLPATTRDAAQVTDPSPIPQSCDWRHVCAQTLVLGILLKIKD